MFNMRNSKPKTNKQKQNNAITSLHFDLNLLFVQTIFDNIIQSINQSIIINLTILPDNSKLTLAIRRLLVASLKML